MLTTQELHDYLDPYYYGIRASWALAVAIAFLFACVTLAHLVLLLLRRAWFLIPLAIGALGTSLFQRLTRKLRKIFQSSLTFLSVETTGYGFRAEGLREVVPKPSTYVTSSTLIIIAPAFMTASLYQLLARMALVSGRATSKRLALKLGLGFGLGALDVLSYALQAAGKQVLFLGFLGEATLFNSSPVLVSFVPSFTDTLFRRSKTPVRSIRPSRIQGLQSHLDSQPFPLPVPRR